MRKARERIGQSAHSNATPNPGARKPRLGIVRRPHNSNAASKQAMLGTACDIKDKADIASDGEGEFLWNVQWHDASMVFSCEPSLVCSAPSATATALEGQNASEEDRDSVDSITVAQQIPSLKAVGSVATWCSNDAYRMGGTSELYET